MIRRMSIVAFSLALVLASNIAAAQPGSLASARNFAGVVTDEEGDPIPGVEVAVMTGGEASRAVISSSDGRFAFGDLPTGIVQLRMRRLGYRSSDFEVVNSANASRPVSFVLKAVPSELDEVLVSADATRLREFAEHRVKRSSFGKFYDDAEIRRKGVSHTSELFRNMPGITIRALPSGGNAVRIRGCQPMLWVDGQRVPGAEMDEVSNPSDIAGIEFYTSMAGTPAQYTDRTTRACGTVLIWTKNQ